MLVVYLLKLALKQFSKKKKCIKYLLFEVKMWVAEQDQAYFFMSCRKADANFLLNKENKKDLIPNFTKI